MSSSTKDYYYGYYNINNNNKLSRILAYVSIVSSIYYCKFTRINGTNEIKLIFQMSSKISDIGPVILSFDPGQKFVKYFL